MAQSPLWGNIMQFELKQLIVLPGHQILLKEVTWPMFETILEELGESRAARLSYSQGFLEIMTPLPEHEVCKTLIGNFVEILLEELGIEFWSLGSTTLKNQGMKEGIEPDDCFYIENEAVVRGKDRLDLTKDPPPDLAIEIDITSHTRLANYQVLQVPEVWRFDGQKLSIYKLQEGKYVDSPYSRYFPSLPLTEVIPKYLAQSKQAGRNVTMKAFREWLKQNFGARI